LRNKFDLNHWLSVEEWLHNRIKYLQSLSPEERKIENQRYRAWFRMVKPKVDWLGRMRIRKRSEGIPFGLEPDFVFVPDTCVIKDISIRFHDDDHTPRILLVDCDKGYIRGNYVVVSQAAGRRYKWWKNLGQSEREEYHKKYMELFYKWREYLDELIKRTIEEDPGLADSRWYKHVKEPIPEP
jgi:hypothetical protein